MLNNCENSPPTASISFSEKEKQKKKKETLNMNNQMEIRACTEIL